MSNTQDFADRFLAGMPAGEWTGLRLIHSAGGLMETKGAIHATATHTRSGKAAYIKVFPVRGDSTTTDTRRLLGRARLERVAARINQLSQTSHIPSVPVVYCGFLHEPQSLILAMETVTPLSQILRLGLREDLSLAVLDTIDPENLNDWCHYDICPKNTGITSSNKFVFIDLDSMYNLKESSEISVGAFKHNRVNEPALSAILDGPPPDRRLVQHKQRLEATLLAAECALGLFSGDTVNRGEIDDWLMRSPAGDSTKKTWRPILYALAENRSEPLKSIAAQVRRGSPEKPTVAAMSVAPDVPLSDINSINTWSALEPWRRALRKGSLDAKAQTLYCRRIVELARTTPSDANFWHEASFALLCYEEDPAEAELISTEGLRHHPDDAKMKRTNLTARMWNRDRS